MPTPKQSQDYDAIRRIFAGHAGPLPLEAIAAALVPALPRRTLIRRLADLVAAGDLVKSGSSRATRYKLAAAPAQAVQTEMLPVLSKRGAEILRLVSRPLVARTPIGYDRTFLDRYRPNVSSYLSVAEKQRLAEISRTTEGPGRPAGTHAQRILGRLLIDLSWNSSRLEGNTYSLIDTERLIEAGEHASGKAEADAQMILNHKAAIEFLVEGAADIAFDRYTILNLHALLAENLLPDALAVGRPRRIAVSIAQSVYHPPEVPQLIEECLDQILATASAIENPFEQSLFVMVQMPYLQPFEDVNKRVSRLAANIPLIKANLSPLSFVDVPDDTYTRGVLGIYELKRVELLKDVFLWAYERSAARYAAIRQTIGEPDPFRLRHRQALRQVMAEVIRAPLGKTAAAAHLARWSAEHIAAADRPRFIEIAETELLGLHDGNFARYRVLPREYRDWRAVWDAPTVPPAPTMAGSNKTHQASAKRATPKKR